MYMYFTLKLIYTLSKCYSLTFIPLAFTYSMTSINYFVYVTSRLSRAAVIVTFILNM